MCEKRSSVINVIISNWSAHFWGISHPSYWNYFIWRTIPTEFNQPSNCSFSDMWPLSPPLIRETKIFSHAVVSAAASSKLLEYLKWRYLPHVWVLKDPHYSLDTVHCDALLETAETCRRTKREKSAVSVRRRRHAALQLRIWPRFRWRPLSSSSSDLCRDASTTSCSLTHLQQRHWSDFCLPPSFLPFNHSAEPPVCNHPSYHYTDQLDVKQRDKLDHRFEL